MAKDASTGMPPLKVGYMVIETQRMDDWRRFAVEGIGIHADDLPGGAMALRIDDYQRRFLVRPGPAEDVVAIGFEVEDIDALERASRHLLNEGVRPEPLSQADASDRGVDAVFGFAGPKGLRFEIAAGAARTNAPLDMSTSGFVTGPGGLGHFVMTSRRAAEVSADMERLFGARLSDTISQKVSGVQLELSFYHLNQRHHSIAVGGTKGLKLDPIRKRVQHVSIETARLEDVTAAFGRLRKLGYKMAMGIGQHPNDEVISFYVITPSGFELELGWNSLLVDDETWKVGHHDRMSAWGHFPEDITAGDRLRTAWAALTSPLRAG